MGSICPPCRAQGCIVIKLISVSDHIVQMPARGPSAPAARTAPARLPMPAAQPMRSRERRLRPLPGAVCPSPETAGHSPGSERRYHTGHALRAAGCRTRSQTGQPSAQRGKIPRPAGRTALPERHRPRSLPGADQPRQPPVKQSASPPQPTAKRTSGQQAVRYSASGRSTTCSVA